MTHPHPNSFGGPYGVHPLHPARPVRPDPGRPLRMAMVPAGKTPAALHAYASRRLQSVSVTLTAPGPHSTASTAGGLVDTEHPSPSSPGQGHSRRSRGWGGGVGG